MAAAANQSRTRLRLWLRLLAATNEMERTLRRRLRSEFGTTLPRFDVLAALDRAPDGLSMSELSRRLMVTNGNTTVLVGALEKDGLVRRAVSIADRRSFTVALTETGREAFAANGGNAFPVGLGAAVGDRHGRRQGALATAFTTRGSRSRRTPSRG